MTLPSRPLLGHKAGLRVSQESREELQKKPYRMHGGGLEDHKSPQRKGRAHQGSAKVRRAVSKGKLETSLQTGGDVESVRLRGTVKDCSRSSAEDKLKG